MLHEGLLLAGFSRDRQNVSTKTNLERFRAGYGIGPKALAAVFSDLKIKSPNMQLKDVFMGIHWLKLYLSYPVMAGFWGWDEDTVAKKVKRVARSSATSLGLRRDTAAPGLSQLSSNLATSAK